jgi:outer membrane protein TolC
MNNRLYIGLIVILLTFGSLMFPQAKGQLPIVRIAMVLDGDWELNDSYLGLFRGEILELTRGEFEVQFPENKLILADWTEVSVKKAMDKLLSDPQIDMILAMGIIASHDVASRGDLSKPVIAPFILDAELMGFPLKDGTSQVKNFCYVNIPDRIIRNVQSFLDVVKFKKLAYLINYHYLEAVPELNTRGKNLLKTIGIDLQVVGVDGNIDETLSELSPDVEAVLLGPLTNLPRKEFIRLAGELIKRRLPSFSGFDVSDVELGILACTVTDLFPKVARRVALNVQRILLGEEAGSIPVNIVIGEKLTINDATARAIGVYPNWGVITEAVLINEERAEVERKLDLSSAVQEAVGVNLDLAAKEKFVAAGAQNINEARSKLLPQLNLSGTGLVIDEDRAEASFGTQAERSLSGSLTATQVIFSEPAWANLNIQRSIQKTRELDYEQLRLDIALAASTAYLNVLRAKTFERIQKENLRRTRANLELARVRESVGTAGPAEVYRWESELALNRKAVILSNASRNIAEIELNRLLHRPLEEPFITLEVDIRKQILFTSDEDFLKYTGNQHYWDLFRDFMVVEGLAASPELAMLDAAILAQERILRSASNSFWLPTLAVQGEFSNIFSKGGAGSKSNLDLPSLFQLPELDNTSWSVALNLSFSLFKGGEKSAIRAKAQKELEQLRFEQKAMSERIEQGIRSAFHLTGASHSSIEQAQKAAEAANKSLAVVQEAYAQGAVSILHLLDAQNAAFNADQAAANAVYDFLIVLMESERAAGRFEFFMSAEERLAFIERMRDFFKKSGISLDER